MRRKQLTTKRDPYRQRKVRLRKHVKNGMSEWFSRMLVALRSLTCAATRREISFGAGSSSRSRHEGLEAQTGKTVLSVKSTTRSRRSRHDPVLAKRSVVPHSNMADPSRNSSREKDATFTRESDQGATKRIHVIKRVHSFKQLLGVLSGAAFGYCGKRAWQVLMMPEGGDCAR